MSNKVDVKLDNIIVDLSASEGSDMGRVLSRLLYGNQELLDLIPGWSGCPHDGGTHKLTIKGDRQDILAWLELLIEAYPDSPSRLSWLYQDIISKKEKRFTRDCILSLAA